MREIHVVSYAERLLQAKEYQSALQAEAEAAFTGEPWAARAIRTAVSAATPPPGVDLTAGLTALADSGMEEMARQELERLVAMADPGLDRVECHLFPCLNPERRGGFCYAPGKILVNIPLIEHWPTRLVRNLTHEYSHTLRSRQWPSDERFGFGPAFRYTILEFLIFEGLADNLVEEAHPHPAFPPYAVPEEMVRRFWEAVRPHLHLEHWDAYRVFLTPGPDFPDTIGYAMGYTIVRTILEQTGMTVLDAHRLPYAELLSKGMILGCVPQLD